MDRNGESELASHFTQSAMGERPWAQTLRQFADSFRSTVGMLVVVDAQGVPRSAELHGMTRAEAMNFFAGEAYQKGWQPQFTKLPVHAPYYNRAMPTIAGDPWFRECLSFLNARSQLGMKLPLPGGGMAALVCLQGSTRDEPGDESIEAFSRLAFGVEQTCAIGFVVEREVRTRYALLEALALNADGIVTLDVSGAVSFINDKAAAILRAADGLVYARGEFTTARPPETRRLHALIRDAIGASSRERAKPGGRMLVSRRPGKRPYILHCLPVPGGEAFLTAHAIACVLHIHDMSDESEIRSDILRGTFGLTPREAELCVALVRFGQLEAAASDRNMAYNTARNHLQSVFRKTGTSSQAELMGLLARLPRGQA